MRVCQFSHCSSAFFQPFERQKANKAGMHYCKWKKYYFKKHQVAAKADKRFFPWVQKLFQVFAIFLSFLSLSVTYISACKYESKTFSTCLEEDMNNLVAVFAAAV